MIAGLRVIGVVYCISYGWRCSDVNIIFWSYIIVVGFIVSTNNYDTIGHTMTIKIVAAFFLLFGGQQYHQGAHAFAFPRVAPPLVGMSRQLSHPTHPSRRLPKTSLADNDASSSIHPTTPGIWPNGDALDKKLVKIAIPMICAFLVTPLMGAVDLFWVNRMGNPLAVAGQAASNQVYQTAFWLASFLPSGKQ